MLLQAKQTTHELLQKFHFGQKVNKIRRTSRIARNWKPVKSPNGTFLHTIAPKPQFLSNSLTSFIRAYLVNRKTPASCNDIMAYVENKRGFETKQFRRTITRSLAQLVNYGLVKTENKGRGLTFAWKKH